MQALQILFDPDHALVELDSISVTGSNEIQADWVLSGYLRLPWKPYVRPFKGGPYTLIAD